MTGEPDAGRGRRGTGDAEPAAPDRPPWRDARWRAYDRNGERRYEADARKDLLAAIAADGESAAAYDILHDAAPWRASDCDGDCGEVYGFRTRREAVAHDRECAWARFNRREDAGWRAREAAPGDGPIRLADEPGRPPPAAARRERT